MIEKKGGHGRKGKKHAKGIKYPKGIWYPKGIKDIKYPKDFHPSMIKGQYLCPRIDMAFKKTFGEPGCEHRATSKLNTLLELKEPIKELQFLKSEMVAETPDFKGCATDVFAYDEQGRRFVSESQRRPVLCFERRAMFYVSNSYTGQLKKGEGYEILKKAYFVGLIEHVLFRDHDHYESVFDLRERSTGQNLDVCELRFFEGPKFKKGEEELETLKDVWLYFFTKWDYTTGHIPEAFKKYEVVMDAVRQLDRANWTEADLLQYYVEENRERDWNAAMDYQRIEGMEKGMEKGIEKGIEKGMEKGIEKGIEKGMEKGIEKGRQENARETAIRLSRMGLPPQNIAKGVNLSLAEVKSILRSVIKH